MALLQRGVPLTPSTSSLPATASLLDLATTAGPYAVWHRLRGLSIHFDVFTSLAARPGYSASWVCLDASVVVFPRLGTLALFPFFGWGRR